MARFRFGLGEYKYFAAPLPPLVQALRTHAYPPLAAVANQWETALETATLHPTVHAGLLERCHRGGQTKPTPLLLRYEAGGYNCLHQDIYGDVVFPLQLTCFLSRRAVARHVERDTHNCLILFDASRFVRVEPIGTP
jgi:hypothetical protein